ncbi:unnamed protein product [Sphagnum jensenii]
MLASLRISSWSARKYDKRVTEETNRSHGADSDAGRYNKMLLPGDASSYKALTSHIAATRVLHYEQTLAWSDDGWRLLPVANYQAYTNKMRQARHEYDSLLADFLADYPSLQQAARVKLNGMYKAEDYPNDVSSKYGFAVEYAPVPSGGDFRVQLSQAEIDIIATRTEDRVKDAFEQAHKDAVKRLYECVSRIHERLAQPDAIFRDSLISNASELTDVLSRMNIAGDMNLEALRKQTASLATVQPASLRNDPVTRIQTANQAQGILDSMLAVYGKGIAA